MVFIKPASLPTPEMGPDPTRPEYTLDPQEIRGQPPFDLDTFLTWSEGKKIENSEIFRGNFPNPNQRWVNRPEQQKIDPTRITLHPQPAQIYVSQSI